MAGDDDPPWENEFGKPGDDEATKLDVIEAVPEAVQSKDSTGKHRTLPGFADAIEQTREHYLALGEIKGIKKVLTAFRLIRIGSGDSPDRASLLTEKFRRWMRENAALIEEAMKD